MNVRQFVNTEFGKSCSVGELQPGMLMEANSQYVNEIVIEGLGDTITYSSTQKDALRTIAYQNPITGGEAVFRARAILNLDIEDAYLPYRYSGNTDSSFAPEALIFPNPNKGKFTIHILNQHEGASEFTVYNSLGNSLEYRKQFIQDNALSVDVSYLNQGIYFLDYRIGNKHQVIKLVIIH